MASVVADLSWATGTSMSARIHVKILCFDAVEYHNLAHQLASTQFSERRVDVLKQRSILTLHRSRAMASGHCRPAYEYLGANNSSKNLAQHRPLAQHRLLVAAAAVLVAIGQSLHQPGDFFVALLDYLSLIFSVPF